MTEPMTLAKFNKLLRRDFENGAVLDEIAEALRQREALVTCSHCNGRGNRWYALRGVDKCDVCHGTGRAER